ncbi:uncharacterized protein LOC114521592 [Dendronephthya gigantea]|uniref:uncharacterized protein LOC114521592 n=1 Tax=Dendronephthya gigantea TaxID=151771 RepID=UPI00106DA328|nr:uncharacterized protein LOC114521592 [Dendronephthya gigantea]XP_028397879.1 uncharacterized protein LOC114521592 [Dendronephthya gigantea]
MGKFQATSLALAMTFVALFYYDSCSARGIEIKSPRLDKDKEIQAQKTGKLALHNPHSRQKRGLFSGISKGLTLASWSSYGASMGVTVYHAIRRCEDYRPKPCKHPRCLYLTPCPDFLCQSSENNKNYVDQEKVKMKKQLDEIDASLLRAFKYEVDGKSANINNERILNDINTIYGNVDRFIKGIESVDVQISAKFQERSSTIQAMVNDKRTTVDQIVSSPTIQGIFDKWTWDGTGRFVFSLALTIGYGIYVPLKERFAVNKIYQEMKVDFENKFVGQRTAANPNGLNQPRIHNKFAYVQGLSTKQIQAQIKTAAKAVHKSNQAAKSQTFVSKLIGPVVNGLYTALSVWSVYKQISDCQKITDDMQETALNVTGTRDEIEKIIVTEVNPLFQDIYDQTWKPARDLLTNETILDMLEGIKNLTTEANFTDTSPVNAIEAFLANINTATTSGILYLQEKLIIALDTIEKWFRCIADKQHAIAVVINDCKSGRDTLKVLYDEAGSMYDLNTQTCVDMKIVLHTTLEDLGKIITATALEKGWHGNCLLNNEDLLYRVCSEKEKGFVNPSQIVANVNRTDLSEDMVSNFLTRCPPPKITPKNQASTCLFYCFYKTTQQIATFVGLNENQVLEIIPSCGICSVKESEKTQICYSHFCSGMTASDIEIMVEIPLPTVIDVIKNCVQKCILKDSEKQEVCQQLKCKKYDSKTIASSLKFPLATIEELKPQCDTIVKDCTAAIDDAEKRFVFLLHCSHNFSAGRIVKYVELSLQDVESIIKSKTCDDYLKNGV